MSQAVYFAVCWVLFAVAMTGLITVVWWIDATMGLAATGPLFIALMISGYLLRRWEMRNGSLLDHPKRIDSETEHD